MFFAHVDPSLQDAGLPPQTSTPVMLAGTYSPQEQTAPAIEGGTEVDDEEEEWATTAAAANAQTNTIPEAYGLSGNYPNPFHKTTQFRYELPEGSHVTVAVYDVLGRHVQTLVNEHKPAGYHRVRFDAATLASGTYFCRLDAGGFVATRPMVLVK